MNRYRLGLMTLLLLSACSNGSPGGDGAVGDTDQSVGTDGGVPAGKKMKFVSETVDENHAGTQGVIISNGSRLGVAYYRSLETPVTVTCPPATTKTRPAKDLYFVSYDGSTWGTPVKIAQTIGEGNFGVSAWMKSDGTHYVGFLGGALSELGCHGSDAMLATSADGQLWTTQTYANAGPTGDTVGHWMTIAPDGQGTIQSAYRDVHYGYYEQDGDAKADLRFGATGQAIVAGKGAGLFSVLRYDAQGKAVVAYYNDVQTGAAGGIQLSVQDGLTWQTQQVLAVKTRERIDFETDNNGQWGLSYFDLTKRALHFVESGDLKTWSPPKTVDTNLTRNGEFSSLAYDSKGNPAISYYRCGPYEASDQCDLTQDALMFAYRNNGRWVVTQVDTGGTYRCGTYTSLTFTADDRPVIAYQCVTLRNSDGALVDTLKVATGKWE